MSGTNKSLKTWIPPQLSLLGGEDVAGGPSAKVTENAHVNGVSYFCHVVSIMSPSNMLGTMCVGSNTAAMCNGLGDVCGSGFGAPTS